jgi:DNA-directed RNA polymerase subunit RPC12/RpoP
MMITCPHCGTEMQVELENLLYTSCPHCTKALKITVDVRVRLVTLRDVSTEVNCIIRNNTTCLGAFIRDARDTGCMAPERVERASKAIVSLESFADSLANLYK